jgi:hypothetical protein
MIDEVLGKSDNFVCDEIKLFFLGPVAFALRKLQVTFEISKIDLFPI